jgi:hypothetical protein
VTYRQAEKRGEVTERMKTKFEEHQTKKKAGTWSKES